MPKPYGRISFFQFQQAFSSEDACEARLFKIRWPDGFQCPACGHDQHYDLVRRGLYQCKSCRHQSSLTSGTVMHKTRTPLVKWFWAIFLVAHDKRGLSALSLARKIDVTYKTAWSMLHKIRHAMGKRDSGYKLSGVIQIDDAFFKAGVKKGGDKRGRGTNKVPVLVMVGTKGDAVNFTKMKVVDSVNSTNVKREVKNGVKEKQKFISDGFKAYGVLNGLGHQHASEVVYKPGEEPDYDVLKWVNILVGNAKAFILGTYHGVRKKHLQSYLNEFCYRFNRRFMPEELFDRLLRSSGCCSAEHHLFGNIPRSCCEF